MVQKKKRIDETLDGWLCRGRELRLQTEDARDAVLNFLIFLCICDRLAAAGRYGWRAEEAKRTRTKPTDGREEIEGFECVFAGKG